MKTYGGSGCIDHVFLTSALVGGEWSVSPPGERAPGAHWIGGWVGSRTGLDDMEKRRFLTLLGLELLPLCRPAHSQPLYRLRYPGSEVNVILKYNEFPHFVTSQVPGQSSRIWNEVLHIFWTLFANLYIVLASMMICRRHRSIVIRIDPLLNAYHITLHTLRTFLLLYFLKYLPCRKICKWKLYISKKCLSLCHIFNTVLKFIVWRVSLLLCWLLASADLLAVWIWCSK
jgi:hypothetical protein